LLDLASSLAVCAKAIAILRPRNDAVPFSTPVTPQQGGLFEIVVRAISRCLARASWTLSVWSALPIAVFSRITKFAGVPAFTRMPVQSSLVSFSSRGRCAGMLGPIDLGLGL